MGPIEKGRWREEPVMAAEEWLNAKLPARWGEKQEVASRILRELQELLEILDSRQGAYGAAVWREVHWSQLHSISRYIIGMVAPNGIPWPFASVREKLSEDFNSWVLALHRITCTFPKYGDATTRQRLRKVCSSKKAYRQALEYTVGNSGLRDEREDPWCKQERRESKTAQREWNYWKRYNRRRARRDGRDLCRSFG